MNSALQMNAALRGELGPEVLEEYKDFILLLDSGLAEIEPVECAGVNLYRGVDRPVPEVAVYLRVCVCVFVCLYACLHYCR